LSIREQPFTVKFGRHQIKGDMLHAEDDAVRLVLLHGAGLGTRDRYRSFRASLAQRSIGSLAFDFIGFGETGGDIGDSSLKSRTEQAFAVMDAMKMEGPFFLLGSSMGAYTAVKLLEIYAVEGIIFFVPAVYDIAAYAVPFGEEFSNIIRKNKSWMASDAWNILQAYRGRMLLVAAGKDDVIPGDVIRRIYQASINASSREQYTVQQSPHLLIHYLSRDQIEYEHVLGLVQHHCEKHDAQPGVRVDPR
jgi:pimeloyl-ACP methyl ester carboxylesterase